MGKQKKFITCDGNYAASHIAYMFSEVAAIYPITPSSTMAEHIDEWSSYGRKNLFGDEVKVTELQSEGGASGAVHGSLQSGALTSTFTASQGLLLMIPNMHKIAGELLPGVFHVSARSVAGHALSIFGDHTDVYSTRNTGFALLASGSIQQIMDLAGVAHLASIKTRIPFLHFFDGFRSSHEIQKIEKLEEEDFKGLLDEQALQAFRNNALNPEHPVTRGTAQNPDIYFQAKESANKFYLPVADVVNDYMQEISKITGREYKPFTYYGADDADRVIIAMTTVTEAAKEVVDYLNKQGEKVGLITCHLYRPFSEKYFFNVFPDSVKKVTVLDRSKEPGANGEPLYLDVKELFYDKENKPLIVGGRYGLSSKDTTPRQIISVFENLKSDKPKNHFTIGINDDVTHASLKTGEEVSITPDDIYEAKFYGIGGDGTVGANKNSIKIIGDTTDKYAQGYFAYDSKKSGGLTISHLRFGDSPIRSTYYVNNPNFVACHVPAYLSKYDMLKGIQPGGIFLLNSLWDAEETKKHFPDLLKKQLAEKNINTYIINATKIADEIGLPGRINTIMQAAFFKVTEVIPYNDAVNEMKQAITKTFGRKGEDIVKMNHNAVDKGGENVVKLDIPAEWSKLEATRIEQSLKNVSDFYKKVAAPINAIEGDQLPVSAFEGREDGSFPAGTTQYEKRGIAVNIPEWIPENCIQCNQCAYVCPHGVIRPFLLTGEEASNAPEGTEVIQGKGPIKDYQFRIQISPMDCTGCGSCADTCPSKEKALVMKPLESQMDQNEKWEYMHHTVGYKEDVVDITKNVKNSQFAQPLFEFHGACPGCGETPYIKLLTQLYGDRMIIANATGCSSIYGGSAPSTPYCVNKEGHGPAWANSLFEDNAEYAYGIGMGVKKMRERIAAKMKAALNNGSSSEVKEAFQAWLDTMNDGNSSKEASEKLKQILKKENSDLAKDLLKYEQYFTKKSVWAFGGDGWAYDIGYGGLDHVLASGEDINVLVMDTEVYSNTGGQSSKATPIGAVAKFAASGKKVKKKDLGLMAISYGYVYVAQVAMGANQNQFFKAVKEAEAYDGPSLIIAYSPCINHGIKGGMGKAQQEEKNAVEVGYWHLYRYDPSLGKEGKNPFVLDSKDPDWDKLSDFITSEIRYTSLQKSFPEEADRLFAMAQESLKWRYNSYKRMADMDYSG